jgi:hypothetical protein
MKTLDSHAPRQHARSMANSPESRKFINNISIPGNNICPVPTMRIVAPSVHREFVGIYVGRLYYNLIAYTENVL